MKKVYALFTGDFHVGGFRSIFPPRFEVTVGPTDQDRQVWPLTIAQQYLYSCYQDMLSKLPNEIALFLMGDLIQGHRDPWATKLCALDMQDQRLAAAELLKPLVKKAKRTYICTGTKYHQTDYSDLEACIARDLGAKYAHVHNVKILNKVINALHGHSSVQDYPSTPLERELADSIIKAKLGQAPDADIIVRGHIHPDSFSPLVRYGKIAFFTPCWQIADDFITTRKARYYRSIPIFGAILAEITEEPMTQGIHLKPLIYRSPREETKVETFET